MVRDFNFSLKTEANATINKIKPEKTYANVNFGKTSILSKSNSYFIWVWFGMTFAPALSKVLSEMIVKDIKNAKSDDIILFSGFYQ